MAEAFAPLLEKLADVAFQELQEQITLVIEVKATVKDLTINLNAIKKMLRGVEMRKMKEEDRAVDAWLEELKELTYEMDDVLDQWITENAKLDTEASQNASSSKSKWQKVRSFFLPICFCAKKVSIRHDIAGKIKDLSERVENILTRAKLYDFTTTYNRDSSEFVENNRHVEISIVNESEVWGRRSDENTIISNILAPKNSRNNIVGENRVPVVAVVGVGGIGKTTLARKVKSNLSNNKEEQFDHIIWAGVSNPFDEKRIAKAILQGIGTDDAGDEPEALFNRIRESLKDKKFLLILDDVWTEDYTEWAGFRDALEDGAAESRILVTTRNEGVAVMLGSTYTHHLSPLNDDDAWLILSRYAFSQGSKALPVREKVQNIGRRIAEKCQGLPLAASFMGNLLKFKYTVQQWEEVLDSEVWELKKASEGIFAHLYLSYDDLDPEMKRCFTYCAVFPKDSRIVADQLIRIWIAQGFLSSSGNPEKLESKGRDCFDTLAMRSFFQDFEKDEEDEGQIVTCKIHDIVHDFATFISEKESCVLQKVNDEPRAAFISGKVRHVSLLNEVNLTATDIRKLRSIFSSRYVPSELFSSLDSARVLSLQDCGLQTIPEGMGNFIHLRFLDLSDNPLTELPEEICYLYNLETLDVKSCRNLVQLPSRIRNLVNLRYLINSQTESLRRFPQGFETLISLRTVSELKVGQGYNKLGCLKGLNKLLGSLDIIICLSDNASDSIYLENGELKEKKNIRKLTLRFSSSSMNSEIIEALEPPASLENLTLQRYGGTEFPSWIPSLNMLKVLHIWNSSVQSLPALGKLPYLEILFIYGTGLKVLDRDFLGITNYSSSSAQVAFPSLKKLSFESLEDWETWEDLREEDASSIKVMPCLRELNLYRCNGLEALPHRVLSAASSSNDFTLSMRVCLLLLVRYSKLLGDEWKEISHISNVVKDFN